MLMRDEQMSDLGAAESVAAPAADSPVRSGRSEPRLLLAAERYGLIVLLAVNIVVFSLIPGSGSTFASQANLNNILGGEGACASLGALRHC